MPRRVVLSVAGQGHGASVVVCEDEEVAEIDLDKFDDIVPLGSGGLGDVYKATRRSTGGQVAIKVLRDWSDHEVALKRAERELRALVDLRGHPNVVNVEEVVESDGVLSIVMEYAPGGSVSDLMRARGGHLDFAESLLVGTHTAAALAAAHDLGIIHRDIKPHNLLIGAFGQVKVCDFGIASLTRTEAVSDRTTSLSLRYASPEELRGEQDVTSASDIYSLAATLHQLLTGQYLPLPDGTAGSLPLRNWMAPDEVPSDVEVDFRTLVIRAGDRTPANRPTAKELHHRFEELTGRLGPNRVRALPLVTLGLEDVTTVRGAPVVGPDSSGPAGGRSDVPGAAAAAAGLAAAGAAAAGSSVGPTGPGTVGPPSVAPDVTAVRPATASTDPDATVAQPVTAAGAGAAVDATTPVHAAGTGPPGVPPGSPPNGDAATGDGGSAVRRAVAVFSVLAVLLGGVVAAFAFGWIGGDGDGAVAASTTTPTVTSAPNVTVTTVAATTTEATATTVPATTAADTTTAATTTLPPRYDGPQCPGDGACIEMASISFLDGEYAIEWDANFAPSNGSTHAHFFWDVYDASQVGSASENQAPWELTDQQPFVPSGEMSIDSRPADATGICVTPADASHAVIDPSYFHCALVPAGIPDPSTPSLWSAG